MKLPPLVRSVARVLGWEPARPHQNEGEEVVQEAIQAFFMEAVRMMLDEIDSRIEAGLDCTKQIKRLVAFEKEYRKLNEPSSLQPPQTPEAVHR